MLPTPEMQKSSVGGTGLTASRPSPSRWGLSPGPGETCPNHPASQAASSSTHARLSSFAGRAQCALPSPRAVARGTKTGSEKSTLGQRKPETVHKSHLYLMLLLLGNSRTESALRREKKCIKPLLLKQKQFTALSPRGLNRGKGSREGNSPKEFQAAVSVEEVAGEQGIR